MSLSFDAAYEAWRADNDSRRTREVPCFDIAQTVEVPAFPDYGHAYRKEKK